MSYDTWKCAPPDEEFETEACGHVVGTCVCDEAPVAVDGLTCANAPTVAAEAERRRVVELARRDWAVRVLDAVIDGKSAWWECDHLAVLWVCGVHADGGRFVQHGEGTTAAAARLAAALAVLSTLDAATRAELGECP